MPIRRPSAVGINSTDVSDSPELIKQFTIADICMLYQEEPRHNIVMEAYLVGNANAFSSNAMEYVNVSVMNHCPYHVVRRCYYSSLWNIAVKAIQDTSIRKKSVCEFLKITTERPNIARGPLPVETIIQVLFPRKPRNRNKLNDNIVISQDVLSALAEEGIPTSDAKKVLPLMLSRGEISTDTIGERSKLLSYSKERRQIVSKILNNICMERIKEMALAM